MPSASESTTAKTAVFDGLKAHLGRSEQQLRTVALDLFRKHFPAHHVTLVKEDKFDFHSFSSAGKATLTHEPHDEQIQAWSAVRKYTAPRRRLDAEKGHLEDDMDFARYALEYNGQPFVLYRTQWYELREYGDVQYWAVLAPADSAADDGHHPATDALLLDVARWTMELHNEIYVFDNSRWKKSKSLWRSVSTASWDDVIMDPKVKQSLIDDVQGFFESRALYAKFRVPWKRGVILHGVPGNGKTCSIKALMNYLGTLEQPVPSLYVKSLDNKCHMPQWSVESIFNKAREMSPCLLIFEDLDSLISKKVRSYFLNEVDGLESNDGILMIGSTNHLDKLDPAIAKRPSRFDRKYHFRIPDLAQRQQYADYWRQKLVGTDLDFPVDICPLIATLTESFSFAYLKELFVVSLLVVARGGKGDEEASNWEELSETQSAPGAEPAEPAEQVEEAKTADADCAHCKHIKAEGKDKPAAKKKAKKPKAVVPTIDVPDSLKDNVFLRVMQQQVKILLHEMDNTEEEEKPAGIMAMGGDDEAEGDADDSSLE